MCDHEGRTRALCLSAATAVLTTTAKNPPARTRDHPRCASPRLTTRPPGERAWLIPLHPVGSSVFIAPDNRLVGFRPTTRVRGSTGSPAPAGPTRRRLAAVVTLPTGGAAGCVGVRPHQRQESRGHVGWGTRWYSSPSARGRPAGRGRVTQAVFAWSSPGRVPSADAELGTVVATAVDDVRT
jgi:hypothetical protein